MILTDREIQVALREEQIKIDPRPNDQVAISSMAVDLTLADTFRTWKEIGGQIVRPGAPEYKYSALMALQTETIGSFELKPKGFVLAWTKEKISIPEASRIAARVEGKSSLARLGISIHVTAPIIHSGFSGQIQLEMYNFGPYTVLLDPGMYVCQLVFDQTFGTPSKGYRGMFKDQTQALGRAS